MAVAPMSAMPCCAACPITACSTGRTIPAASSTAARCVPARSERRRKRGHAGTAFLTLRSDGMDKYAQADGRFVGKPGTPTNVSNDGPALTGATNLMLGTIDHREVAFHPRAFREIFKFIAGREPSRMEIMGEAEVRLSGLVTATPGGIQTGGATVEIYQVSPD